MSLGIELKRSREGCEPWNAKLIKLVAGSDREDIFSRPSRLR
jgi:hypothetical protein